jgi:hypothetical protein
MAAPAPQRNPMELNAAVPSQFDLLIAKHRLRPYGVAGPAELDIDEVELWVHEAERQHTLSQWHQSDERSAARAAKLFEIIQLRRGAARALQTSILVTDVLMLTDAYTAYRGGDAAARAVALSSAYGNAMEWEYRDAIGAESPFDVDAALAAARAAAGGPGAGAVAAAAAAAARAAPAPAPAAAPAPAPAAPPPPPPPPAAPAPPPPDRYRGTDIANDLAEMEEKPISEWLAQVNTAADPHGRKIIFRQGNSFYSISVKSIQDAINDRSSIFYQCKRQMAGAPAEADVFWERPYFRLQLNGNMLIPFGLIQTAIDPANPVRVFGITEAGLRLPFVTSSQSIIRNGNWYGVNIVGSDHCQMGSDAPVYTLHSLARIPPSGGRRKKTRRTVRRRKMKKMSRKRATSSWV